MNIYNTLNRDVIAWCVHFVFVDKTGYVYMLRKIYIDLLSNSGEESK